MIVVVAFNLLLLVTSGYAIWKGGKPEQWAGAALLTAAALTLLTNLLNEVGPFHNMEPVVMLVDIGLLAALVALALKANRYWPIWITAIHASAVAIHFAKLANPALVWPLYAFAASVSSVPIQIILLWATIRHQRRMKLYGIDTPWRGS